MEAATAPGPAPAQGAASKKLAFAAVFLVEMWERFGYYGMQAVIVLFMVQSLGYTDKTANLTFGAFTAMVYAAPAIGGFLGDKYLGARRMTVLGAIVLCLGYVLLSLPGTSMLFVALGVIAVGNGLFKANPANLVSKIYQDQPERIDSAFTMYYMAVNVGATLSQIATPLIGLWVGWRPAFAVCAGGLAVGLINYFAMKRHLAHVGSKPDFEPLRLGRLAAVLVGSVAAVAFIVLVVKDQAVARIVVGAAAAALVGIFGLLIARGSSSERRGLIAVAILTLQAILFFIFYQQMGTSLTLFALRNVDLHFLFGYVVPAGQVQALNPIWVFILSPVLAWYYTRRNQSGKGDFSIPAKFAVGFIVLAAGFFVYGLSGHFAQDGRVPFAWVILGYGLQSLGELLISGLGLAMVARYVGPSLRGFIMGVYFLATGLSQYAGGVVANFASVPQDVTDPVQTLGLYTNLFWWLGVVAVGGGVVAFALLPLMKKLSKVSEAAAPAAA